MSVFSKIRGFFSRHRNKIIIGGVIISGSIYLTHYAQQKLKEWQEKEALEFLERNRKHQHFDSIGRTCNQTIVNLATALNEVVVKTANTEEIIEQIKRNPGDKLLLWNELKILVFTKATSTIYVNVMLVITLKIQLSIIGGYLYRDPNSLTADMQEKYLSICQNLLNSGFEKLFSFMEKKCRTVLDSVDLKKQLKLSDLEAIFWSIQTAIATDIDNPIDKLRDYVMLEIGQNLSNVYGKVVRDTVDFLNSDEIKTLATHCVNRGFMLLVEKLSEFYGINNGDFHREEKFTNPYTVKKPMAKLLPIINGFFGKKSLADQFIQQLIQYEKLQTLSANVYESLL